MNPTKILILPKLIYKFNKIAVEITIGLYNNWETSSKLTIEIVKETRIAMTFFKNKVGRLYLLNTKSYYKATGIKAQEYAANQWAQTAPETDHIEEHFIYDKDGTAKQWGINHLFNKSCWTNLVLYRGEKRNRTPASHYTQKWILGRL